jgi:HK97 family phage prohead protease
VKRLNEKQWRDEKELRDAVLLKAVDTEVTEGAQERVLNFRISTETVDSYNDVIKADGWDLERFKKNPVVLWAHSHYQPPVGQALSVEVEDGDLVASAQFADAETYAFADTVYRLLKKGFLRATSVGFFPKEWTYDEDRGGYNFINQELYEFSVVPVPANPDALQMALRAGEIDCTPLREWAEKTLDMWTPNESVALWIPKQQVEDLYKSLTGDVTPILTEAEKAAEAEAIAEVVAGEATDAVVVTETTTDTTVVKTDPVIEVDGVPVPEIKEIKFKLDVAEPEEPTEEVLKETIDVMSDEIEDLKAQVDQLVAATAVEKTTEDDSDDLSEVIDLSIDPHEVENEIDLSVLDLDVDPEELQGVIRKTLESELMNRTGKLPKEV